MKILTNVVIKPNIYSYATRSHDKIHQWTPMHDYTRKCVHYNIPINITEKVYTHSVQDFSKYVKLNLLQSYQENYNLSLLHML